MVQEWFKLANRDLIAALALFDLNNSELRLLTAFHCQQACEKAIKGFLVYKNILFCKTHDLGKLGFEVEKICPELLSTLVEAKLLTPYAAEHRYPDAALKNIENEDVVFAINVAKKLVGELSKRII